MAKKFLLLPVAMALGVAALHAQNRAPQNDSIRAADLRADLFFLAGDSLRGRLTDTEENRAAADFIKSRFERMGLKPAGPNGSYYQPYSLMTATLGEGNALEITPATAAPRGACATGRSSTRIASAPAATCPARWCSPASASARRSFSTTTTTA